MEAGRVPGEQEREKGSLVREERELTGEVLCLDFPLPLNWGTRLGTEEDKAAVRALVGKIKFGPL